MSKEILYVTCNTFDEKIVKLCQSYLRKINLPIISISLNKDIDFGDKRIRYDGEYGRASVVRQLLIGCEASKADVLYICDSDVLYHPSHFEFDPPRKDAFYFNTNWWSLRWSDGKFFWPGGKESDKKALGDMCGSKEMLTEYFKRKKARIDDRGDRWAKRPTEPGRYNRYFTRKVKGRTGLTSGKIYFYMSEYPNIDIRHDKNMTSIYFRKLQYWADRNLHLDLGWKMADDIPFWGRGVDLIGSA